ncbi:MAG: hypothetical protein ACRENN_03345 [Candidatus Eiseniibacteriota bacterium]
MKSWSRSYLYDYQGNVRVYRYQVKGSGCTPGSSAVEYFGANGYLVGFEFRGLKKYYWMGAEVTFKEYYGRLDTFYGFYGPRRPLH